MPPKKEIPWNLIMRQLRAGHPLPDIAEWTVGVNVFTIRARARTELAERNPAIYAEYRRLTMKNRRPSGGRYGSPGRRAQCGTRGGANRHRRLKEPVCLACGLADAEYAAEYYRKNRSKRRKNSARQEDDH